MTAIATEIPEGFERQTRRSPLTDPWEPIYSKQTPEALILGLRLARPHTNARGFAHGGLIAALTDKAMGHSCAHKMGGAHSLVTVGMAIDFISSAQIGQWLTVVLCAMRGHRRWRHYRACEWHVPGGQED